MVTLGRWTYQQSTGKMIAPDGTVDGMCYSGFDMGLNNPSMQNHPDLGPIPQGLYHITNWRDDLGGKGRMVADLQPELGNLMFGRSGFMVHGDNPGVNFTASRGCIVAGRAIRLSMKISEADMLEVVA